MSMTKSRISSLDWARAQALGHIKSLAAKYANEGPSEWTWTVGRLLKDDPHVLVTVSDSKLGCTSTHLLTVNLPNAKIEEEMQRLFENMVFQNQCILNTLKRGRKTSS